MDLADRLVPRQQACADEMDEREDVAPVIGHQDHDRLGMCRADPVAQFYGPFCEMGDRDEEVELDPCFGQHGLELVPDVEIVKMDHHCEARPPGTAPRREGAQIDHFRRRGVACEPTVEQLAEDAVLGLAVAEVMLERPDLAVAQIGIEAQVGRRGEGLVRLPAERLPEAGVMPDRKGPVERIYAVGNPAVIFAVESAAAPDAPGIEVARGARHQKGGSAGQLVKEVRWHCRDSSVQIEPALAPAARRLNRRLSAPAGRGDTAAEAAGQMPGRAPISGRHRRATHRLRHKLRRTPRACCRSGAREG
ncbi:hypothetical protein JSE7799_01241 [Jannaschia seosinensis]|uniref:Uncharacterized protein n=1 Tax=Jannaschia seosinensis TaxID=313367 RepID=A0A0M7BB87_9RHOB|nr:hypothetical protein JSE7799_01241 [Jannaschia seosinensis]